MAVAVIDGGLIPRWATFFEADRDAALAYRSELQRDGRPTDPVGQAKQLALSVALTEPEYRCEHFGDRRHCPWCPEPLEERLRSENRRLEAENEQLRRRLGGVGG
jgi:hypothetical protein